MKHKLFTLLLAVMASTSMLFAQSGTCGDNLSWDLTDGVLTISGTGEMTNYSSWFIGPAPWYDYRSIIKSAVIEEGVTSIGDYAFNACTSLTSVTIGNSVTSIGSRAFYNCSGLTSVTIPNSVTSIGSRAFEDCSGLTSVTIPNSVTNIGENAFYGVFNIIYYGNAIGAPWGARSVNGYVEGYLVYSDEAKTNLLACSSAATGDIDIPESVTSIGKDAFYNCSGLTSVTINTGSITIDNSLFGTANITIGENVEKITIWNDIQNTITYLNPNTLIYIASAYAPASTQSIYDTDGDGEMEFISGAVLYNMNGEKVGDLPTLKTNSSYYSYYYFANFNNDAYIDIAPYTTTLGNYYINVNNSYSLLPVDLSKAPNNIYINSKPSISHFQLDANLYGRMDFYSIEDVDKYTNPMGTHYFHLRQADGSYLKTQLTILTDTAAINSAMLELWESSSNSGLTPMYWSTMPSLSDGWMHRAPKRNSKADDSLQPLMMRRATAATDLAYADFTSIDTSIDLDRNGLLDLMSSTTGAVLYNLGNNRFLMGQFPGQVTVKDLNGDGIMDYIIYDAKNKVVTLQIYEGEGLFKTQTLMQNMAISNVWCYDFDNDGDVDILLPFDYTKTSGYAYLVFFRNDGNNTFKKVENAFDDPNWHFKFMGCKDVDNDGKYEIIAVDSVGYNSTYSSADAIVKKGDYYLVRYNNKLKVSVDATPFISNTITSSTSVPYFISGDFDNDGVLNYWTKYGSYYTASHFPSVTPNTAPAKMSKPRMILDAQRQMLNISWDRGSDAESSALDLEYSIRIGSASGLSDIWFAAAGADGKQRSLWGGNVGAWLNQWVNVAGWAEGDYYIAVQAIDPNNLGGAWSDEVVYHHSLLSADFTLDVPELSTADTLVVQYDGVVNPNYTYTWNFGDSAIILSQEGQTYKLAYNTGGIKTISLQVTNATGQTSPLVTKQVQIDAVRWDAMPQNDRFTYVDLDGDGVMEGFGRYNDVDGFFTYKGNDEFKKVAKTYNTDIDAGSYAYKYPKGLNVQDYNMDGLPDVVFPTNKGNVMLNRGDLDIEFYNDSSITTYDKNPNENFIYHYGYSYSSTEKDINADGLLDRVYIESIKLNNGDGTYKTITPGYYPSINMGMVEDFNNDGYLDICTWKNRKTLRFYLGDADYRYSETIDITITGNYTIYMPNNYYQSIVSVRDVDNNGYVDLFVRGSECNFIVYMYPDWSITVQPTPGFEDNDKGETRLKGYPFVDVNSDGIPDVSYDYYKGYFLKSRITNEAPSAPTNLRVSQTEKGVLCSWDAGIDRETPAAQMKYNISIKKKNAQVGVDSAFIISPVNGLSDDAAIVPGYPYWRGTNFIVPITRFEVGQEYELQVQSIDLWGAHSPMSQVYTFKIENQVSISMPDEACKNDNVTVKYIGTETGTQQWNWDGGYAYDNGNGVYQVSWTTGGVKTVTLTVNGMTTSRSIYVKDNDDNALSFSLPDAVLSDTWVEFLMPDAFKDPSAKIKMRTSSNIEDAVQRLEGTLKARVRFQRSESIESGWIEFYQEDATCGEKNNYRATTQVMGYAPAPQISIVTVDAATGKNCVIWDAPANLPSYIDKIYVYKEEGSTNNWVRQAEIALSAGQWIDMASDPAVRKNRYCITYGTNFGAESNKSTAHSSTHLQMNVGLQGANNLIWTKYEGGTIDSYRILRGTTPDNMTVIATVPGTEYTYTDLNAPEGVYYALEYDNLYFEKWVWITASGAPAHMPAAYLAATRNGHSNVMASSESSEVTFAEKINICAMEKTIALNSEQTSLHLYAEILPAMATYKRASWKIISGEELATIDDNGLLVANTDGLNGTLRVRATAIDGSGIYAEKDIVVSGLNNDILVTGISLKSISGGTMFTANNTQIIVEALVTPADATNTELTWEVLNGADKVNIAPEQFTCTLTLNSSAQNGDVLLSATAKDGSGIYATLQLTVDVEAALVYHTVTFRDWDNSFIDEQQILHGGAAIAPANPTREGYIFSGWDSDFSYVTSDLTVIATYTQKSEGTIYYTITFQNWDGAVLQSSEVEEGVTPVYTGSTPTRTATETYTYTFKGWSPTIVAATADAIYTATYTATEKGGGQGGNDDVTYYTVEFYDWDDTLLKSQTVEEGKAATAPDDPYRSGYRFIGWDKEFTNVRSNLTIYALYQKLSEGVEEVQGDKVQCTKILRDGQIYIIRGDKTYTVTGQEVK